MRHRRVLRGDVRHDAVGAQLGELSESVGGHAPLDLGQRWAGSRGALPTQ